MLASKWFANSILKANTPAQPRISTKRESKVKLDSAIDRATWK
jgi:hypothetical protein